MTLQKLKVQSKIIFIDKKMAEWSLDIILNPKQLFLNLQHFYSRRQKIRKGVTMNGTFKNDPRWLILE